MGSSMKLGRRTALKAGVGAGAAMLGAPAVVQAQAAVKLPLATVWPDGNFHTVNAKRYADEVKTATVGRRRDRRASRAVSSASRAPSSCARCATGWCRWPTSSTSSRSATSRSWASRASRSSANNIDELKVLHKYLRPEYEKVAAEEQPDHPLHGAVADPVPAPQGQGRVARRA